MTDTQLYSKISALPPKLKIEVMDFVDFLHAKKKLTKRKPKKKRVFGYAKGTITIKSNFDEPLEEFKDYM